MVWRVIDGVQMKAGGWNRPNRRTSMMRLSLLDSRDVVLLLLSLYWLFLLLRKSLDNNSGRGSDRSRRTASHGGEGSAYSQADPEPGRPSANDSHLDK